MGYGRKRGWSQVFTYIALTALLFQLSQGMQRVVYNNFVADELHFNAQQLGFIESLREVPGLATIALAAVTAYFFRSTLAGICLAITGVGLLFYAHSSSLTEMLMGTVIMSSGFHLFYPIQSVQVLESVGQGEKAGRLGELNSITAAATLAAMGFVFVMAKTISYRGFFVVSAGVAALASALMFAVPRTKANASTRKFVFRTKYMNYYILNLLSGARRHMYITFAAFALVKLYGQSVRAMSMLMVVANILAIFTRPAMGRIIDRMGERRALILNYSAVIVLSLGYAYLHWIWLIYIVYIADGVLQGFDVAQTTYMDKIALKEEIPGTLAMGSTINHITGVAVPTVGGFLWETFGPWATFLGAALLGVLSTYSAWRINVEKESAWLHEHEHKQALPEAAVGQ